MTTVAEYIAQFPPEIQEILVRVRKLIQETLPEAEETIKYRMPTYYYKENLVHFAAAKKHLGFYPAPAVIENFTEALRPYKTSKGAIQFPYTKEIPYKLIREMTCWRWQQVTKQDS
ncbi:iron chaperone [Enterococcus sp. LJL90]